MLSEGEGRAYISLPNMKNLFCQTQKFIFINYLWNIRQQI